MKHATETIDMGEEFDTSEDIVDAVQAIIELGAQVHGNRKLVQELIISLAFDNFRDEHGSEQAEIVLQSLRAMLTAR